MILSQGGNENSEKSRDEVVCVEVFAGSGSVSAPTRPGHVRHAHLNRCVVS